MEPTDYKETNAYAEELVEAWGVQYTALIREAGTFLRTIRRAEFDSMNLEHVEGRYRALAQLDGMKKAAIAIIAVETTWRDASSELTVNENVTEVADRITRDVIAYQESEILRARAERHRAERGN